MNVVFFFVYIYIHHPLQVSFFVTRFVRNSFCGPFTTMRRGAHDGLAQLMSTNFKGYHRKTNIMS